MILGVERIAKPATETPVPCAEHELTRPETVSPTPLPGFAAIERLADATGIMQHSRHSVPDPDHGYCLDDNARALILMHRRSDLPDTIHDRWTAVFADFVARAWNPERKRFRNFMSYEGDWLEEAGSEDSSGRAIWSLGVTAAEARSIGLRNWALDLFTQAAGPMLDVRSPRAMAFCMLGATAVLRQDRANRKAAEIVEAFGVRLGRLAAAHGRPGWTWFEPVLAYDNCRLPEALLRAGMVMGNEDFTALGLRTLDWIADKQTAAEGHFSSVGSTSFGREYSDPSPHDQQPLEAHGMVEACEAAFAAARDPLWIDRAEKAHGWFLGANDGGIQLGDPESGECYDGLTPTGPNLNRGAESVLAFQLSSCAIARLRMQRTES